MLHYLYQEKQVLAVLSCERWRNTLNVYRALNSSKGTIGIEKYIEDDLLDNPDIAKLCELIKQLRDKGLIKSQWMEHPDKMENPVKEKRKIRFHQLTEKGRLAL